MKKTGKELMIPDELVMNKIYLIRGQKVMLDKDLAELYGVETRILNQAVNRNPERFPKDFMFRLNKKEWDSLRSQFVILDAGRGKYPKYLPVAFTEQGVSMLSGVLNSETAIRVHVQIIRVFAKIREMIMTHKDIFPQLEKMEKKLTGHDKDIALAFKWPPQTPPRRGFRTLQLEYSLHF